MRAAVGPPQHYQLARTGTNTPALAASRYNVLTPQGWGIPASVSGVVPHNWGR